MVKINSFFFSKLFDENDTLRMDRLFVRPKIKVDVLRLGINLVVNSVRWCCGKPPIGGEVVMQFRSGSVSSKVLVSPPTSRRTSKAVVSGITNSSSAVDERNHNSDSDVGLMNGSTEPVSRRSARVVNL